MKSASSKRIAVPNLMDSGPPWFDLLRHQLSSAEINELHLSAAESGLSVNQWMDRAIRTALRETFPKSSPSSVKSSPHDS
jgi:hypothetical protein